jgi:plasmid maintenance system antidote protein VapI
MAEPTQQRPGDALRAAGIDPSNPWDFLARRLPMTQITPNIAADLAAQTGITVEFWLNMQEAFNGRPSNDTH